MSKTVWAIEFEPGGPTQSNAGLLHAIVPETIHTLEVETADGCPKFELSEDEMTSLISDDAIFQKWKTVVGIRLLGEVCQGASAWTVRSTEKTY